MATSYCCSAAWLRASNLLTLLLASSDRMASGQSDCAGCCLQGLAAWTLLGQLPGQVLTQEEAQARGTPCAPLLCTQQAKSARSGEAP